MYCKRLQYHSADCDPQECLSGTAGIPSTLVTSASSGTSDPTASPSSGSPPSSTSKSGGGLSTGATAGLGAGISVGALAVLAFAGFFIWRKRRGSAQAKKTLDDDVTPPPDGPTGRIDEKKALVYAHSAPTGASELDGPTELYSPPAPAVAEMGTDAFVSDLPGDSNYLHTSPKTNDARMSTVSELDADVGRRGK